LVYARYVYGGKHESSLIDFKKHNGFVQVDVPRYFVPLTWLGRNGLRGGFYKQLGELVPDSVLARARRLRAWWYQRRLPRTR
jgi:hypothetical protein